MDDGEFVAFELRGVVLALYTGDGGRTVGTHRGHVVIGYDSPAWSHTEKLDAEV